jgi:hypothetical protein
MTMREDIETRLLRAVAVDPSDDDLRRLDERVARAIAMPAARATGGSWRALFLRPLMLALLLLLVAGAVGATMGLLDRMIEESDAGWRTAWDRAEIVGMRETDAGVTVTLERAYADLNQVLVGFTVEGLDGSASAAEAPVEWRAVITDPSGRTAEDWATSATGREQAETGLSAFIQTWEGDPAQMGGTWVLTFTSIGHPSNGMLPGQCTVGAPDPECVNPPPSGMVDGNWTFAFDMPAPAGTAVAPNVGDTVEAATVTVTELIISPTMVRAALALRVDGVDVSSWQWVNGSVRRGEVTYAFNASDHVTLGIDDQGVEGDVNRFMAPEGADDPSGSWTIEIPELSYSLGNGSPDTRVEGLWTLTVTVP